MYETNFIICVLTCDIFSSQTSHLYALHGIKHASQGRRWCWEPVQNSKLGCILCALWPDQMIYALCPSEVTSETSPLSNEIIHQSKYQSWIPFIPHARDELTTSKYLVTLCFALDFLPIKHDVPDVMWWPYVDYSLNKLNSWDMNHMCFVMCGVPGFIVENKLCTPIGHLCVSLRVTDTLQFPAWKNGHMSVVDSLVASPDSIQVSHPLSHSTCTFKTVLSDHL